MITALLVVLALASVSWLTLRRRFAQCAPTPDDLARTMAGDAMIGTPTHSAMDAITIDASPDDIWPWLVQIGYQRGGLYSYDWLDRIFGFLDRPSANRVLPEFQQLAVGDIIRLGRRQQLTVAALEPSRALVLHYEARGFEWVWQFGLYPIDTDRTRVVSRGTERFRKNLGTSLFMEVMKRAAFIMTRRMLLGLKKRSETLRQERVRHGSSERAASSLRSEWQGKTMSADGASKPKGSAVDVWLLLSIPIASLTAIAAGSGVFIRGLYRDAPFFAVQAVAQDFITLFVVLPTLVVSAWLSARGSDRGRLVWLGALVYLVYSFVIDAFEVRFNPLFLVYVGLLGCALYALIGGVITTDMNGIKARFAGRAPTKSVSAFLALLAVTFYAVWLGEAVPAMLAGTVPLSVQQNGTPTNAVHVLDMAWMLPAFLIAAVGLARKTVLGYTLTGVALTFVVLLALAVLSIVVLMVRGGHPVVVAQVVLFGTIFLLGVGLLAWYLNALRFPARPNVGVSSLPRSA